MEKNKQNLLVCISFNYDLSKLIDLKQIIDLYFNNYSFHYNIIIHLDVDNKETIKYLTKYYNQKMLDSVIKIFLHANSFGLSTIYKYHISNNICLYHLFTNPHVHKSINLDKNNKLEMVISQYNEDIDWIYNNKLQDISIIYNKNNTIHKNYKKSIILDNIGRETHTYLYHIVNNYNNLSPITIFTQAKPFDHCNSFIEEINNLDENISFKEFSNALLVVRNYKCSNHNCLQIKPTCDKIFKNCPETFYFSPGALFAVSKNQIHKRSLEFYKKCIRLVDYSIHPNEGYVFERVWRLIFDENIETI